MPHRLFCKHLAPTNGCFTLRITFADVFESNLCENETRCFTAHTLRINHVDVLFVRCFCRRNVELRSRMPGTHYSQFSLNFIHSYLRKCTTYFVTRNIFLLSQYRLTFTASCSSFSVGSCLSNLVCNLHKFFPSLSTYHKFTEPHLSKH